MARSQAATWAGPPTLAVTSLKKGSELVRFAPDSGKVLARRTLPGMVYEIFATEAGYVARFALDESGDTGTAVAAFDTGTLQERWRRADGRPNP